MNFLFPGLLWGLLVIAIPVIVHLFNLRRAKKVYFSNVAFLAKLKSTSSSKLVLKHYLALLFRSLFFIFLVLTFAIPIFQEEKQAIQTSMKTTIYLDNSLSNSNLFNESITCLDQNFQALNSLLDNSEANQKFRLITNDPYGNSSRSDLIKEKVMEKLSEVELSTESKSLEKITSKIDKGDQKVYLFSDFQKNQFDFETLGDTSNQYYLVPSYYSSKRNIYIDSIYLDNPMIDQSRKNALNIVFKNAGIESINDLAINFLVNNLQLSTNSISVGGRKTETLKIDLSGLNDSINYCEVNFEDFPITFDNRFYFTIEQSEPISILEISNNGSSAFKAVYGSSIFDFNQNNASNIDYSLLKNADLVIANELSLDNDGLVTQLENFVNNQGSLLIIPPAENINIENYRRLTSSTAKISKHAVLGLAKPKEKDPFFRGIFDENPKDAIMPKSDRVIHWVAGKSILNFLNGEAYLSEIKKSSGKVYLLASNLNNPSSDFTKNAIFVPVMYTIAFSGVSSKPFQLYERINQGMVSLNLPASNRERIFKLKNEDQEIIPAQRIIDGKLWINLSSTSMNPGFWQITDGNEVLDVIAVNHNQLESQINQYAENELKVIAENYENVTLVDAQSVSSGLDVFNTDPLRKNLWKYSLILALVFFFAEVLTLRFL